MNQFIDPSLSLEQQDLLLLYKFYFTIMRLFLAVDLPDEIKEKISKIRIDDFIGKRVEKDNLHINIKFFGEVPTHERIVKKLETVKFKPFKVLINGFNSFPNKKFPKVLHLRVESSELTELQKIIDRTLKNFEKRPYTPHVTLMRVKEQEQPTMIYEQEFREEFTVKGITLFQSVLKPYGPEYEKVHILRAAE